MNIIILKGGGGGLGVGFQLCHNSSYLSHLPDAPVRFLNILMNILMIPKKAVNFRMNKHYDRGFKDPHQ